MQVTKSEQYEKSLDLSPMYCSVVQMLVVCTDPSAEDNSALSGYFSVLKFSTIVVLNTMRYLKLQVMYEMLHF